MNPTQPDLQPSNLRIWSNRILSSVMVILLAIAIVLEINEPRDKAGETYLRILIYSVVGLYYGWKSIQAWRQALNP